AKRLTEIMTWTFWSMLILSLIVLALAVLADKWVDRSQMLQRISQWFETKKEWSDLIVRVAAFATLIVAWQQGTVFAPELVHDNVWIERLQFGILVLLLFPATTTLAGIGMVSLWGFGAVTFGWFHMLDYVNFLGVAYFLVVRPLKPGWLRSSALPVLYATVGITLMWLGCEKLAFPQWAIYILEQNPVLTLGLPTDFFLTSAAFIELGLGFMLLICLFSRSLAVTITLVFFLTTCVFGKVEVIGHTLVHAALIVFLFEGAGSTFTPPSLFHKTSVMRIAFATVNFTIAVFLLLSAYIWSADQIEAPPKHEHPAYELAADSSAIPTVTIDATPDSKGGWNVHLTTTNFTFAPERVGETNIDGEGHAHLYLDNRKIARVYGDWFHVPQQSPGAHTLRATLNTHDHSDYWVNGKPIAAEISIEQPRESSASKSTSTRNVSVSRRTGNGDFLCIGR
ncbi:MAG: hypothetical protein AAF497_23385, partial [Planctomycetota bacterium]